MSEEYKDMLIHELKERGYNDIVIHSMEIHDKSFVAYASFTWNLNGWIKQVNNIMKLGHIENGILKIF